jgi:hypothetical protein
MAFDVYVGTLTRFYTEEWENVAQKYAREQGINYQIIHPDGDKGQPPSADEARPAIIAWRKGVFQSLRGYLRDPLEWDESDCLPYFTDRPGWDGYAALLLWAAYSEHPEQDMPELIPKENWTDDEVFLATLEKDSGTRYRQILEPELWLPCDFDFTFQAPNVANQPTWIGSTIALAKQLELLNDATFRINEEQLAECLNGKGGTETELEAAEFAFAIFISLAQKANEHCVPMILSY